jgi:hypothetical protein
MDFVEGAANDIVKVYVDGVLDHIGTSWEDYYRDCELNPTRTVDSVLFRTGGTAAPDTLGFGFVVDNFTVSTSAIETLVVDDDGLAATGNCNANDAATDNIQQAIDGASAGDVVTVCPGTYSEALKIDKDLTLSGVDAPTTVVSVPAGLGVSSCNAGEGRVLVDVCGGAVTIDDLTMSGPGDGSQGCVGSVNYGVFVSNDATLNLVDSVVRDIREPGTGLEGCQTGIGVRAGSRFLGETAHLTMSGSSVTGYQKGGVVVDGPGTDATISGNTIDGGAASLAIARNGVQIGREASATVSGNTIAGNECDLAGVCGPDPIDSSQAAGVLVFEAGSGTVISDNTITTSDMGVYNDTAGSPVSVTGNTITARYEGVYLGDATTDVSHNTITGAATAGVVAVSADWYAGDTNGTVTSNQLLDNGTGISIIDDDTGDALVVNLTAAFNRIVGNGTGVSNSGAATVDAHNNWWGCSLGPAHPGCDDATGAVTTDPRLILRVAASPTSTTSTSTITANLNRNSNGQNVSSLGHIPDGTPVSFSTNNGLLTSTSEVTVNGVATTTLKANGNTGPAKVTATVDNQSQIAKVKLAKPNLAIVDYSHAEGDSGTTPFTFIVKLSSASDQTVTVDYATANGTASSANDYVATSGTVTFLPGETQKTITVDVNGDVNVESNETFFVDLSNASTHVVLTDGHAAGKILTDD